MSPLGAQPSPPSPSPTRISVGTGDGIEIDLWRSADAGVPDDAPAVIVCHGYIQNRFAFESPRRSLLAHLRSLGLVVYVLELRGRRGPPHVPRRAPQHEIASGFRDYVDIDAAAAVAFVKARHRSVAWLGHSMGGLIGALLDDEARDEIDAVVTIGAPVFAGRPEIGRLFPPARSVAGARFAHAKGFRFEGWRWSQLLYRSRRVLDVARVPMPLRIWAPGSLDHASLAYTLQKSFSDDSWAVIADLLEMIVTDGDRAGTLYAGARLAHFDKPLLVVAGDADDLAPPSGARPLFERAGTRDKEYLELPAGHIDLLIGEHAPARVWLPITRFLRRHLPLSR